MIAFVGVCVPADAQPQFPQTHSIESTVINADLVFIAKLDDFREAEEGKNDKPHEATILVEETLKKEAFTYEPYRRLAIRIARPASVLEDWKKRSCRLLVFYEQYAPAAGVMELSRDKLQVMTADMTLLREPKAVVQAARKALRRVPAGVKRLHTFQLQVPRKVIAGTEWESCYKSGGCLLLSVPVDRQLEKRAHEYLRSQSGQKRGEGARALLYFKSDRNIELVKPLLNDPDVTYRQPAYEGNPEERVYGVRFEAYRTLRSWGVNVKKPVIREKVQKPQNSDGSSAPACS